MVAGCGGSAGDGRPSGGPHGGSPAGKSFGEGGGFGGAAAVPVEISRVRRRTISSYIETHGALEAENEVDVVARAAGPIVELNVEEGDRVAKGELLARLDDAEYRAQMEIARVALVEATQAYERAKSLAASELLSPESYEQARAAYDSSRAQVEASGILLGYTEIRAPFDGLIINRYVDFAEQIGANSALFRISDFDPLLCPIQVPERELPKLRVGQKAYAIVEPWPDRRFPAGVLRVSPVVEAATGTVKVTLEVDADPKLRPGMFARVFVETAQHPDALVIPKSALSLESIGDTVYVAVDGVAERREVELGVREGDYVQVVSGLAENEPIVVVGQDGLSDGTPIQILAADGRPTADDGDTTTRAATEPGTRPGGPDGPPRGKRKGKGRPDIDFSQMTPERLERVKEFMRARGMSEEQIEQRIRQARERSASGDSP
jgi:RND family efflux transporter MFP subunit